MGHPAKPSAIPHSTRCSLCKKDNIATLNVPKKGAICLDCLKELNLTVESLMAPQSQPSATVTTSTAATVPIMALQTPPVAKDSFSGLPILPDSDVFGSAPPKQLTPWRGSTVPAKRRKRKHTLVGVVLGGMAGIFIAMLILRLGFGINPFAAPEKEPQRQKVERISRAT